MKIGGLNKLTTQDFPEKLACIVFTEGCNFNCSYCYNRELVESRGDNISVDEVMDYLRSRRKMLDGVVISGGEPTIWSDLEEFILQIRELGLQIKLDTNGYRPEVLKDLLDKKLLDYVAMDIKETFDKYPQVVGLKIDPKKVKESIKILKKSGIPYEFRTTIIKGIHSIEDLDEVVKIIGESPYYLQNFQLAEHVKDKKLESFTHDELVEIKKHFEGKSNVIVRYI